MFNSGFIEYLADFLRVARVNKDKFWQILTELFQHFSDGFSFESVQGPQDCPRVVFQFEASLLWAVAYDVKNFGLHSNKVPQILFGPYFAFKSYLRLERTLY